MKKMYLICIWCILFNNLFGQISTPSTPPSFDNILLQNFPIHTLSKVNTDQLVQEDIVEQQQTKATPLRFGLDFPVQLNLNNSGVWEDLPNGDKVWRLGIESKRAKSINFIFDDFYMPKGGELFIYNKDKSYLIGAFTPINNKPHGKFSTAPVKGEMVILEYYEPKVVKGQGRIQISSIVHAYRDMFKTANSYIQNLDKGFGDSGNCNVDVNCTEGNNSQNEKRSVAMILTNGNTRWCSGVMVNNTLQDTTPYLLTAHHCLDGNEATWLFIFNYESETCNGADGDLTQSISGSITRADYSYTDMSLLKLSAIPPPNYLVYYAGWNNSNSPSVSSTCIHHPSGDVKKISIDNQPPIDGINYNSDHWRVQNWEAGTTEGGSSGAPLFDQNHHVIGQLHGGLASCSNSQYDEFGKFSTSWLGGGTPSTQLKNWLDPTNTGANTLNGTYFITTPFADNITIDSISNISTCGQVQIPKITVKNQGSNVITALEITYQYSNGTTQTLQWNGSISWLQTKVISLPIENLSLGNQSLTVSVSIVNVTDEDITDNTATKNFTINNSDSSIEINLKTDGWPEETSYKIIDNNGNTIFAVNSAQITGPAFENILLTNNACLPDGCYKAIIKDSYGDGLIGGLNSAAGYFEITTDTTQLGIINGNFGSSDTITFCLPNFVDTKPIYSQVDIELFPNPTNGMLNFSTAELPDEIIINNIIGKQLLQINNPTISNIDMTNFRKGIYFIRFRFDNQWIVRKVVLV